VPRSDFIEKRYWAVYVLWIAVSCAIIGATIYLPDASRTNGRVESEEAERHALLALHKLDPKRYAGYEVVAVTASGRGELGEEARWVVLCDREQRSGLSSAVVVELGADDFHLMRIRKPSS
jgi:hypothetical protein